MPRKDVGDTDAIRVYLGKKAGAWTIEPPRIVVKEWAEMRGVNTSGTGRWNIKQTHDILIVAQSIKEITKLIKAYRRKNQIL